MYYSTLVLPTTTFRFFKPSSNDISKYTPLGSVFKTHFEFGLGCFNIPSLEFGLNQGRMHKQGFRNLLTMVAEAWLG